MSPSRYSSKHGNAQLTVTRVPNQGVGATYNHELRPLELLTCTVVTPPDAPVPSHELSYSISVRQLRTSADLRTKSPRTKSQQMALTVPYRVRSIQRETTRELRLLDHSASHVLCVTY